MLYAPPMSDELATMGDLLIQPGFHAGLIAGVIAASIALSLSLIGRRSLYGWALLLAAASAMGVAWRIEVDSTSTSALLILAVAGLLVDLTHRYLGKTFTGAVLSWFPGVIGAVWAASLIGVESPGWMMLGLAGFVLVFAVGLWVASRSPLGALLGPMVAIAVGGLWVTVPETDVVVVFVGAVIPLALFTLRPVSARVLASGALAYAGLLGWVVTGGGLARPWTVIGAWSAALGITVVATVSTMRRPRPWLSFVIFLVYAFLVTRVADIVDTDLAMAGASVALMVLTGVSTWIILGPRLTPQAEPSPVSAGT